MNNESFESMIYAIGENSLPKERMRLFIPAVLIQTIRSRSLFIFTNHNKANLMLFATLFFSLSV